VLGPIKAKPLRVAAETRPALTGPARVDLEIRWVGAKKRAIKSNKETDHEKG
jgi:hypothetical protein